MEQFCADIQKLEMKAAFEANPVDILQICCYNRTIGTRKYNLKQRRLHPEGVLPRCRRLFCFSKRSE